MQSEMLGYGAQQLASQPTLCASWRMATELPSQLVMWNKETLVARLAEAKDLAHVLHSELVIHRGTLHVSGTYDSQLHQCRKLGTACFSDALCVECR